MAHLAWLEAGAGAGGGAGGEGGGAGGAVGLLAGEGAGAGLATCRPSAVASNLRASIVLGALRIAPGQPSLDVIEAPLHLTRSDSPHLCSTSLFSLQAEMADGLEITLGKL